MRKKSKAVLLVLPFEEKIIYKKSSFNTFNNPGEGYEPDTVTHRRTHTGYMEKHVS